MGAPPRSGPKLIFEHMHLYQVLSDTKFWEHCPEFLDLREEGDAAHHKILIHVLGGEPGCLTCSTIKAVLREYQPLFAAKVVELAKKGGEGIDRFVTYISNKRGYRPEPIIVYYRGNDGTIKELQL